MLLPSDHVVATGWPDYALRDSGDGRKLERFGPWSLVRPEPQAIWRPSLPAKAWDNAGGIFATKASENEERAGQWTFAPQVPAEWMLAYRDIKLICRPTPFGHVGLFPEQAPHWDWMIERIGGVQGRKPRLLNLFGYTGAASLLAAAAGAEVTHVDASRRAITWARENQAASGLDSAAIRWICEDANKFVGRELRRTNRYSGILLDPPRYGRGPANEIWRIEQVGELLRNCAQLLDGKGAFIVLTVYAVRLSYLALYRLTQQALADWPGTSEVGELLVREEKSERLLPTSFFVRWTRKA